jgi:hypothetical protein
MLEQGHTRAEIVAQLVAAHGIDQAEAEEIVDRSLAEEGG